MAWPAFLAIVTFVLVFDLGVLTKRDHVTGVEESLTLSAFYVTAGLALGLSGWQAFGSEKGLRFYTGFLIEKSLSLDNIFVISLIVATLAITPTYRHRVLFQGILGVIATPRRHDLRGPGAGQQPLLDAVHPWRHPGRHRHPHAVRLGRRQVTA